MYFISKTIENRLLFGKRDVHTGDDSNDKIRRASLRNGFRLHKRPDPLHHSIREVYACMRVCRRVLCLIVCRSVCVLLSLDCVFSSSFGLVLVCGRVYEFTSLQREKQNRTQPVEKCKKLAKAHISF